MLPLTAWLIALSCAFLSSAAGFADGGSRRQQQQQRVEAPHTLLWDGAALLRARAAVARHDAALAAACVGLRADAAAALLVKPVSVTTKAAAPIGGDLHDYTTHGSYWWPCTAACNASMFADCSLWKQSHACCNATSGLPWVVHDGYNDPASALDRPKLSAMIQAVNALSASAFFFNNSTHAEHAALLLRVWFLDSSTAMHPSAKYCESQYKRHLLLEFLLKMQS